MARTKNLGLRIEDVEPRLNAGETLRAVAASLGITHQCLSSQRRRWGLPPIRASRLPIGEQNPAWKGGVHIDRWGYVNIRTRRAGRVAPYIAEHILVAEGVLGRQLRRDEVVHHINGEKTDNRPENLLVTSRANHRVLHRQLEELALHFLREGRISFDGMRYCLC